MTWNASAHPRAAAGTAGGGQFAPLSYDSAKKTGAGYGKAKGDPRVRRAQEALNKAGLTDGRGHPLVIDGKLGPRTTESIKAYQREHGLTPDGRITPKLLAALKKSGPGRKAALAKPLKARAKKPARKPAVPLQRPDTGR